MLDPAGKSLYLQAWWYRGWSGLGPSARFHCPLSLPFKMHQVTLICAPTTLALREGMSAVCGHPHQDRQRLCLPRRTGNQHMGSSSLQWPVLCSISDPDLNSAPCAQEVQAELLGCEMLLPHAGNWVSSWRAVCLCRVTHFLSRREMLDFCTSVCRIRTLSD